MHKLCGILFIKKKKEWICKQKKRKRDEHNSPLNFLYGVNNFILFSIFIDVSSSIVKIIMKKEKMMMICEYAENYY